MKTAYGRVNEKILTLWLERDYKFTRNPADNLQILSFETRIVYK